MITSSQLAKELAKRGIQVEKRTLRDWWTEGLLPRPRSQGKGRGKGKVSGWHELDVMDRAEEIFALKRRRERFKNAHHLELFVLGYLVAYRDLQIGLLSLLDYVEQCVLQEKPSFEDIDFRNTFLRVCRTVTRRQASQTGFSRDNLADLWSECLDAIFIPSAGGDQEFSELAHTADSWLKLHAPKHIPPFDLTAGMLKSFLKWLQSNISLTALRQLVSAAGKHDFQRAQQIWLSWREVVRQLTQKSPGQNFAELEALGRTFSLAVKGPILLALLWFGQHGFAQQLLASAEKFSQHLAGIDVILMPDITNDLGQMSISERAV